jgi:hypothetical protein
MTVATEVTHAQFNGNGVTTVFPFNFRIFNSSDLKVTVIDAAENITTLTLGTDYSISGVGAYAGGSITLTTALQTGKTIALDRQMPVTQETSIRNQGTFLPEIHEDAFDKLTMLNQQTNSVINLRALLKPTFLSKFFDAVSFRIGNLANPVNAQDASSKSYVDSAAQNLSDTAASNLNRSLHTPMGEVLTQLPVAAVRKGKFAAYDSANGDRIEIPMENTSAAGLALNLASSTGTQYVGGALRFHDVMLEGCVGDGITDDFTALSNIFSRGGCIYFRNTGHPYVISSKIPTPATEYRIFVETGVVFSPASNLPSYAANVNHQPDGETVSRKITGGTTSFGNASFSANIEADGSYLGNAVGVFGSAIGYGAGNIWGMNVVSRSDNGFSGVLQGIEIDVDVAGNGVPAGVIGLEINGAKHAGYTGVLMQNLQSSGITISYSQAGDGYRTGLTVNRARTGIGLNANDVGVEGLYINGYDSNAIEIHSLASAPDDHAQYVQYKGLGDVKLKITNAGQVYAQEFRGLNGGSGISKIDNYVTVVILNISPGAGQTITFNGADTAITSGASNIPVSQRYNMINANFADLPNYIQKSVDVSSSGYAQIKLWNMGSVTLSASVIVNIQSITIVQ